MDMLNFEVDKNSIEESLSGANREVMRMARLVDSAMNHSLMYDNSYAMLPIDIATLLRKGTDTYHILMERNENLLTFDIEDSLPNIFGNADMLLLVLSNLLSNANRHTRAGQIKIIARAEIPLPKVRGNNEGSRKNSGYVKITVKDNGCGVKPEILPNIFQRGISEGSTGLGLSICQSTIEAHRGKIGIESTLGEGTSVWFSIPIYQK
jgi:two-component system sensor histidine kinase NblS